MQITLQTQATADALVIPVVQTDTLADTLAQLAPTVGLPAATVQADFKADRNEILLAYRPDGHKTYLLGLGKDPGANHWLRTVREFFFRQKRKLPASLTVDLRPFSPDVLEAVALGIRGGGYDLRLYQQQKDEGPALYGDGGHVTLRVTDASDEPYADALRRAEAMAGTQREMLDLMNAPANYVTPQTLADWAVRSGERYGYTVTVLDRAAMAQQGLQAVLAVNKGSDQPPAFIIADYRPDGPDTVPTVGLVGKGITFDTGGISIKGSANMHLMKSDMGGAAAVLGTLEAAAKLKLPVRLIGIVPTTENMVDGGATRPGDVIGSYSGKTIEIIDTDAEGRVILADGLSYAVRRFAPDVLLDLATLTGSVISTLGYHAAGLFTANDALAAELLGAADRTGERLWRLPLWDVYQDDIKSDVADVKNFSGKPMAGAIAAAKFLEVFTDEHPAWAHLDIAGTAFGDTEFGTQKNATGYGIRLLIDYLRNLTQLSA